MKVNGNGAEGSAPRAPLPLSAVRPKPKKPWYLDLDKDRQRLFDVLKRLVPDWRQNAAWWKRSLYEDPEQLAVSLDRLFQHIEAGKPFKNGPGAWLTDDLKRGDIPADSFENDAEPEY